MTIVLDASAVLALLRGEPGGETVAKVVDGAMISSVNFSELVGFYAKAGAAPEEIRDRLALLSMVIVAVDEQLAFDAGLLRASSVRFGLSLGDRMCLALAARESATVMTADKIWTTFGALVGIRVELIR